MKWHERLARDSIVSFPVLQMLSSVILDSSGSISVTKGNGRHHPRELLEIQADSISYELEIKVSNRHHEERRWLTSALMRAGILVPEWAGGMEAIWGFDDIIVGVDTNILHNCVITEHFLDAIMGKQLYSYSQKPNWILLAVPSTTLLEIENAANSSHSGHLTHAGRMGFRSLQELFQLQRNSSYTGLSVVIVGDKGPHPERSFTIMDQKSSRTERGDSRDGNRDEGHVKRVEHADFLIRNDFKRFLDRINFYKGIFFMTSDKTNAMLAETEGMSTLYAKNPSIVKQGNRLRPATQRCVLLSRVIYEIAVEFGSIDLYWNHEKYGSQHIELEGAWLWKDMSNWARWDVKAGNSSSTAGKTLDSYRHWSIPVETLEEEWSDIVDNYMV